MHMMAIRRMAGRFADALEAALGMLAAVILMAMLALVVAGVVLRYGPHTGVIGMEDLGIWLNIALISAGLPLTLSGPLSMRLDGLARLLPDRASGVLALVADGCAPLARARPEPARGARSLPR